MIALNPGAAGALMLRLGVQITAQFGRPRAVLMVSAHSTARRPVLLAASWRPFVKRLRQFSLMWVEAETEV